MNTVRVVSSHPESQGPFVILDPAQYDPAVHQLYQEQEAAPEAAPPSDPEQVTPSPEAPAPRRKR